MPLWKATQNNRQHPGRQSGTYHERGTWGPGDSDWQPKTINTMPNLEIVDTSYLVALDSEESP